MAVTKKMLISDKQLKWLILYNKTKKRLKNHELIKLIPKLIKLFYCEFKLRDWSELNNRKRKKKKFAPLYVTDRRMIMKWLAATGWIFQWRYSLPPLTYRWVTKNHVKVIILKFYLKVLQHVFK